MSAHLVLLDGLHLVSRQGGLVARQGGVQGGQGQLDADGRCVAGHVQGCAEIRNTGSLMSTDRDSLMRIADALQVTCRAANEKMLVNVNE